MMTNYGHHFTILRLQSRLLHGEGLAPVQLFIFYITSHRKPIDPLTTAGQLLLFNENIPPKKYE